MQAAVADSDDENDGAEDVVVSDSSTGSAAVVARLVLLSLAHRRLSLVQQLVTGSILR
jgi:hypothetical protein